MQVDWVGDTLNISDPVTGGTMKAYVFVACLPCSMYGYAEAFPDMKTPSWLSGHIHAYEFFGGVPRIAIPDNCKTSTIRNTRTEVVLNRSYHEMAEYYGTAVIPARPLLMCARFIRLILYTYRNICQRAIVNTCSIMQSIIWTGQKRSVLRRGS